MNLTRSIKQILLAASIASIATFAASSIAAVGIQIPPPGPGMVPDYFGATPNYANSPQPVFAVVSVTDTGGTGAVLAATTYDYMAGSYTTGIKDVQVVNGGIGYTSNTVITISGGPGVLPVTVTPVITNGVITSIAEFDPTNTLYVGANVAPTNVVGTGFNIPLVGTGIRKFVDTLPGFQTKGVGVSSYATAAHGYNATTGANNLGQVIPEAIPDTTTFPGSDYYVIALREYTQKMHTDLPATHLRGYVQLDASGVPMTTNQYLGPMIVAQKGRPVRVKMVNQLSIGAAGNMPIPVDVTYMGANDTQNRTAMHLHGGNTPWISDGTPRQWVKPKGETGANKGESARNVPDMWFDASGNLLTNSSTCTQGSTTCTTANATNDPGNGALTFYYTNQQSARLMFYHDHSEGLTRLNVYSGVVAPYLLQDTAEQALVSNGTLPAMADTIPLVIQEKTFVPSNTTPVLNFYGPFKSQLNSQDPTWRWGAGSTDTLTGPGDLWAPHVYMPNQNPGDTTGANNLGRWDYGPWFWPPFTGIQNNMVTNPYYDSACVTAISGYCEGQFIPGLPNGNTPAGLNASLPANYPAADKAQLLTLGSPTGTPESFNDTPLVNGTVYPYINVDPKQYRLRILSVGNDRMLNLSLVVAASKNSDATSAGNTGTANNAVMCDGTTAVNPADCTEVKMVPWNDTQNVAKPFPSWWYTQQKGGVSLDGRPSGVFDPDTRGPAMVQIGVDGGFLSTPAVIRNQPVNFEYNPKNIVIGNVKEHALLVGPAERADVLVDFSNFAGSTLLMYNDSPAPIPAFDLRLDYYTASPDNTDTGGAFSTVPGYGPNTRTLMQIRVSNNGGIVGAKTHQDDTGTIGVTWGTDPAGKVMVTGGALTSAIQTAFKTSQEPIIIPQNIYNGVYGNTVNDVLGQNLSRISDTTLTYNPLADPLTGLLETTAVTLDMQPKSIIEDFTVDYGRMNAMLGVEMPKTTAITNTATPQAFIDPPTELVKITPNDGSPISGTLADGTQLWKVSHNGVDTHAIHFHLFHVQLINRVGWDGMLRTPEANEMGWKDIIRMNPLEDVIVALRPRTMTLPFKVANSHRKLDPSGLADTNPALFYNLNPVDSTASDVSNVSSNFGWEYLWHCHILGHEENDMMRSIAVAQPPETPSIGAITGTASALVVNWTDNSVISNWVTLQRASDSSFTKDLATFNLLENECAVQSGCARSYVDTTASNTGNLFYYRITAQNTVGAGDGRQDVPRNPVDGTYGASLPAEIASVVPGFTGYANVTASSAWSNTGIKQFVPIAFVTPPSLAFGSQALATSSAAQTVTVFNSGTGNLIISKVALSDTINYALTNNCNASVAQSANCTINVIFKPTTPVSVSTVIPATLTITDNSNGVAGSVQTVNLSGTAVPSPGASVSANALAFGNSLITVSSTAKTITLTNDGTGLLSIASIVASPALFTQTNTCPTTLAVGANCAINLSYKPTAVAASTGTLIITDNKGLVAGSTQSVALTGTGLTAVNPVMTASLNPLPVNLLATANLSWTVSSPLPTQADSVYQVQRSAALSSTTTACPAVATAINYPVLAVTTSPTLTSATDSSIVAGKSYCYRVVAVNPQGTFTSLATLAASRVDVPLAPAAPSLLTTIFTSVNSATLGWTTSLTGVQPTGYIVQECLNTAANCTATSVNWVLAQGTFGATGKTFIVTGLTALNGTTANPFLFRVLAYDPSPTAWLTSTAVSYPAPAAPTALTNSFDLGGASINLGWTAGVSATLPAATGYTVQQCTSTVASITTTCSSVSTSWVNAAGTLSGTSFNVTNLTAGSLYMFRVIATDPVASTALTSTAVSYPAPATPTAATVSFVSGNGGSLNFGWSAGVSATLPAATGYTVQQCAGTATTCTATAGTWTTLNSIAASATNYNVTGLTAGSSYVFRVSATDPVASAPLLSAAVILTAPAIPGVPTASFVTGTPTSLNVNWTASATTGMLAATGYTVQQCQAATVCNATTGAWINATGTLTGTSYNVTGLTQGLPYWFRVSATNGLASAYATTAAVKAYPLAVADSATSTVVATTTTGNQVLSSGLTGMNILTNDQPLALAGRSITGLSAVTHATGGTATATVSISTTGVVTFTVNTTSATGTAAQTAKKGTYTFSYTLSYGGIASSAVTDTITVN